MSAGQNQGANALIVVYRVLKGLFCPFYRNPFIVYTIALTIIALWPFDFGFLHKNEVSISCSVSLAVVEFFRMIPSAIVFSDRNKRLGRPAYPLSVSTFLIWLFGMTNENRTIGKKVGVIDRCRRHGSGQDKAMVGIHRGMLFGPIVVISFWTIQSESRSRQNFFGFPFLSSLPLGVLCLTLSCFSLSLLTGRLVDLTSLASTAMPSLIVGAYASNWRRISELIRNHFCAAACI